MDGIAQLRRLTSQDRERVRRFVRDLSPASRHARFHGGVTELSDSVLAVLTDGSAQGRAAIVLEPHRPRNHERDDIALAHLAPGDRSDSVELAVVVADRWQGRGLGRRLLAHLVESARDMGYRSLVGDVLAGNAAMLHLAGQLGFTVRAHPGEPNLLRIERRL
jgi:acetyltransferase